MKKVLSVLLVMAVILSQTIVFADGENLSAGITETQAKYESYITEAVSESEYEETEIDKDNIFIVELTNPMAIKNNSAPMMIYVALPIVNTEDISYAGFVKDEYVTAITNFSSLAAVENPYGNKLKQYIEDNNLSEPTEIKVLQIIERVHLFAYFVVCDNIPYIIPYHFTDESNFNITNAEECNLEYGKAYTVDEFKSICDKEQVLFEEERKKQAENQDKDVTYIDDDGEVVEEKAETNKTDSVKEGEETEQEDTEKEIFTFDDLTQISTKEIKKLSVACSRDGRTEFTTSSPRIISKIVDSVKTMKFEKDITAGGGAGGWIYGINFYLEDGTYIQFGARLHIDKINYISLEPEAANDIMSHYHDLMGSVDSSDWATDQILESIELHLLEGLSEPNYKEPITREEFCELVFNLICAVNKGFHTDDRAVKFTDTDNHKVQALTKAEIIYGKSETEFAPKDLLTREEAATILVRMINREMPMAATEMWFEFDDINDISDWASSSVQTMCNLGFMIGVNGNRFAPKDTYTVEQAIVTLMRIYEATRRTYIYETPLGVIQSEEDYNSHINFAIECEAKVELIEDRENYSETYYIIEKPVKALTDQTNHMLISFDDFAEIFNGKWQLKDGVFEFNYDTSYEVKLTKFEKNEAGNGKEWPNKTEAVNVITFYPDMSTIKVNGDDTEIKLQYGGREYTGAITMYEGQLYIPVQMVADLLNFDVAALQAIY